jgi:hypothetical protein
MFKAFSLQRFSEAAQGAHSWFFDFKHGRIINSIGTKDASFSKHRRPNRIRQFETEPKSFVAKDLNWRKKMTSKRFRE